MKGFFLVLNNIEGKSDPREQSWRLKDLGRTCGQKQNKVTEDKGSRSVGTRHVSRRAHRACTRPRSGPSVALWPRHSIASGNFFWCP